VRLPGFLGRWERARFFIVGGAIYSTGGSQWSLEELEQLAERLGIRGEVAFTGFRSDRPAVYRDLDVAVHASTRPEPFGLAVIEAMSSGCATIVSKAGGAAELFRDGVEAIGVLPGDEAGLSAAMSLLISNPMIRRDLGKKGRHRMLDQFGLNRFGDEWASFYRAI
jgi:glycosyltransferase involved in cell wall biosynthesis